MAENRYPAFDNTQKFIEIGYNIAYYRKHAGLTQEQLAERVGISRQHMAPSKRRISAVRSRWIYYLILPQYWTSSPQSC